MRSLLFKIRLFSLPHPPLSVYFCDWKKKSCDGDGDNDGQLNLTYEATKSYTHRAYKYQSVFHLLLILLTQPQIQSTECRAEMKIRHGLRIFLVRTHVKIARELQLALPSSIKFSEIRSDSDSSVFPGLAHPPPRVHFPCCCSGAFLSFRLSVCRADRRER